MCKSYEIKMPVSLKFDWTATPHLFHVVWSISWYNTVLLTKAWASRSIGPFQRMFATSALPLSIEE